MSDCPDAGRGDRARPPHPGPVVTEAMIQDLVHAFYGRARRDPTLGPIFDRSVRDWDAHLAKLCDFWSSVMLGTRRFRGAPVAVHAQQPAIQAAHFARWLALFRQTATDVCPPQAAALFIARSEIIGDALRTGLAAHRRVVSAAAPPRAARCPSAHPSAD